MKTVPIAEDYRPEIDREALLDVAGGVAAAMKDIAHHKLADWCWEPWGRRDDIPAQAVELRLLLQQLEEPIRAARAAITRVERVARLRAAHRIKRERRQS